MIDDRLQRIKRWVDGMRPGRFGEEEIADWNYLITRLEAAEALINSVGTAWSGPTELFDAWEASK